MSKTDDDDLPGPHNPIDITRNQLAFRYAEDLKHDFWPVFHEYMSILLILRTTPGLPSTVRWIIASYAPSDFHAELQRRHYEILIEPFCGIFEHDLFARRGPLACSLRYWLINPRFYDDFLFPFMSPVSHPIAALEDNRCAQEPWRVWRTFDKKYKTTRDGHMEF